MVPATRERQTGPDEHAVTTKAGPWPWAGRMLRAYHVALFKEARCLLPSQGMVALVHGSHPARPTRVCGAGGASALSGSRRSPARCRVWCLAAAGCPQPGCRPSRECSPRSRDLWADLVVHDPDVRWYLPLHRSNSCDVWLLAWERGQDTDWHDHGGSSGSFAVAEGSLVEQYRAASGRRLSRRQLAPAEAVAFGPGHVHDVAHGGEDSATSIHAYSPPLLAMTYYQATDYGLIARETVAIEGAEGARGRGGADTALADATASAAELRSEALPGGAPSIDELLAEARGGLAATAPGGGPRRPDRRCGAGRHPAA